jgi:hypothetical protein
MKAVNINIIRCKYAIRKGLESTTNNDQIVFC